MLTLTFPDVLAPAIGASHTRSGPVARCLEGTRQKVIAEIIRQFEEHNHPICWLKGPAGYGKSAISQSVAERYDAQKRLATSFFFLRGAGDRDRSVIGRLITTIANQLTVSVPSTKQYILNAVENEPFITSESLQHQFTKLVTEPVLESCCTTTGWLPKLLNSIWSVGQSILSLPSPIKPTTIIIVIDALDECDDKESMGEFIETIINAFLRYPELHLRFLITSRIEEHIRWKLDTPTACSVVHQLSLEDFEVDEDIHMFFRSSFDTIYHQNRPVMRSISLPWPSESDIQSLVKKSSGSFLFAVTLMDVIRKGKGIPQDKLETVLAAEAGLDALYTQVLSDADRDQKFEHILGAVMLLRDSPSISFLAHLLWVRPADIVQSLLGIQSILMIPKDDFQPIQLFHTSLRDFLTSQPRSNKFFIRPPACHLAITIDCLSIICMLPAKGVFYYGVHKYACMCWCYHLHQVLVDEGDYTFGPLDGSLAMHLQEFASQSLSLWVNTLLDNGYKDTLDVLMLALSVLEVSFIPLHMKC